MHQQYPVPLYVGRFRQCEQFEQDLTAFLARLKKDGILKHKINKANNEDHVVQIAKDEGFSLDKQSFWLYESKDFKRHVARRGFYAKCW